VINAKDKSTLTGEAKEVEQEIELSKEGLQRCAFSIYFPRTCRGLLSSLVLQLSAESDSCYNILSRLYSDNMNGTREPDTDSLKECMKDMLNLPGQCPTWAFSESVDADINSIYISVDALDECPDLT
jgi:hypothetical protein